MPPVRKAGVIPPDSALPSGGIACIQSGKAYARPMPESDRDVWDHLTGNGLMVNPRHVFAVLEKVGGYNSSEGAQPGSAMFKFGAEYGRVRMALTAAGVPFEEVTPQAWQKAMGVPPRKNKEGETKTQFKNRLKAKAQQLFPDVKVTLAVADALLIAEYCRRKREGRL
jgi:hypothetical protein